MMSTREGWMDQHITQFNTVYWYYICWIYCTVKVLQIMDFHYVRISNVLLKCHGTCCDWKILTFEPQYKPAYQMFTNAWSFLICEMLQNYGLWKSQYLGGPLAQRLLFKVLTKLYQFKHLMYTVDEKLTSCMRVCICLCIYCMDQHTYN